jgi:NAD(P)H-hydrate epimerase
MGHPQWISCEKRVKLYGVMYAETLQKEDIVKLLPPRRKDCSKRDNGKGLLIAGSAGFSGAALMASCAALRAGIGTLKTLVPEPVAGALFVLPEAMCARYPKEDWDEGAVSYAKLYIDDATVIALGPGLGRGVGREELLRAVLAAGKPAVVDADGLFALSLIEDKRAVLHENVVLTPHLGEMERLTGIKAADIAARQAEIAQRFACEWGCTVLLKHYESVVASPDGRAARNVTGNPGLAKGGSGDVLAGIVLALLGQGLAPYDAACAGSYLLGASANEALGILRERMLMARDVVQAIEKTMERF